MIRFYQIFNNYSSLIHCFQYYSHFIMCNRVLSSRIKSGEVENKFKNKNDQKKE